MADFLSTMSPEEADQQLLELVHGDDAKSFQLTITVDSGRWSIVCVDMDGGTRSIGEGASFLEAWVRQKPDWARGT